MCKTAYSILIERVVKYVESKGGVLEICFEQVGKSEDAAIYKYTRDLKEQGSPFDKDRSIEYIELENNNYKSTLLGNPKRKTKNNLFIQIADLYLYPMIKRKYDSLYPPWLALFKNKKVIDACLRKTQYKTLGIKYSCFDEV